MRFFDAWGQFAVACMTLALSSCATGDGGDTPAGFSLGRLRPETHAAPSDTVDVKLSGGDGMDQPLAVSMQQGGALNAVDGRLPSTCGSERCPLKGANLNDDNRAVSID